MTKYIRKEERKKQIKLATIKLLEKSGYKSVSVQNIIDEINYSKGGFYNCYSSKEDLFKEILFDSFDYRSKKLLNLKKVYPDMNREEFVIQNLLDKVLDRNDYKKLFISILMEMNTDEKLFKFYHTVNNEMNNKFKGLCDEEGFNEFLPMINEEFNILLSSLILGVEIFKQNDNKAYRNMLKDLFIAYFKSKNLFDKGGA